mmetsp:Transcript_11450/g.13129  ORF Transcript_11450/g.13129 Transcript_11450/m.13129 type:complete len:148 (+) Transcript_11450:67-510(+)
MSNTWRQRSGAGSYQNNKASNPYTATMNNRNNLFGNRGQSNDSSERSRFSEQTQRLYEEQNNAQIDSLGEKIGALKHFAVNIGAELETQNRQLDEMSGQMGGVGELMGGALKQLEVMLNTGGSKHMCYLIGFIVGLFLVLYMLLSWK